MDVIEELLRRIATIVDRVSDGKVVVVYKPTAGPKSEIEKIVTVFEGYQITIVALRYSDEEVLSAGLLGELQFDSIISGPHKTQAEAFLKIATDFSASGMQVWAARHPDNQALMSTGLAAVYNVYHFSNLLNDHNLFLLYRHFLAMTIRYQDFLRSTMDIDS